VPALAVATSDGWHPGQDQGDRGPAHAAQGTHRRHRGRAQRVLRGWCNYFRWGNSSRQFSWIDDYVHKRLALFDSKKRQKRGRRWGRMHTKAWFARLGIFTLSGMVRYIRTATATT